MGRSDSQTDDDGLVELDPSQAEAFLDRTRALDDDGVGLPDIPGFVITGLLGRGATGVVYRARQEAVDREVALKALHRELVTNVRAVKRLKREARLAAQLAHPSIISAIDMGEVDGVWWYAMELVEGVSLGRRIAERGSLTEREVLRLFSPLCDALQHAHEVGVVHRDIKPANILIDGRGRARLVDLGLAVGQNDPAITRTGATLGTPHYISPEQARDPGQADIRSDIWSIGATMYHAVCGRPPFQAGDVASDGVAEILARVLHDPVEDPRGFAPGLSRDFALLLRKCLTRDAAHRYQEPWELVADIELLRERRSLDLRGSRLDSFASRRPAWIAPLLAGALGLSVIAGTWALTKRPWAVPAASGQAELVAALEDWPELLAIRDGFRASGLTHAEAFAELDGLELEGAPEPWRILRDQLLVDLKHELGGAVARCLEEAGAEVDEALDDHAFRRAALTCAGDLDDRLRATTGFPGVALLPRGAARLGALDWRTSQSGRVEEERLRARDAAAAALRMAYPERVRGRVAGLLGEGRWADADAFLDVRSAEDWLQLDGLDLDLRGLDATLRLEVASEIEPLVRSDRSNVRYRMAGAVEEASDFIEAERQAALDQIRAGNVKGPQSVLDGFNAALSAKAAVLSLDEEQLTTEFRTPYLSRLNEVRLEVSMAEALRREELAERALTELEVELVQHRRRRDYGALRAAIAAALEEPWRRSTFPALEARLQEAELLEAVLDRAAEAIEARSGDYLELHFERIPVTGRASARPTSARRLGFGLTVSREIRLQVFLSPTQRTGGRSERVLEGADLLRLAGLGETGTLSAKDRLLAAAFLAAEGDPEAARSLIRLQDYPSDALLPVDLERRARRDAEGLVPGTALPGAQASPQGARPQGALAASFSEAYGVPNQAAVGRRVRLVWDLVDNGAAARDLEASKRLPRGPERIGAWEPGRWSLAPEGLSLFSELGERADFLWGRVGPYLKLAEPLDLEKPLAVRLRLRPGDHRPEGHQVAVSLRGYHLVLVSDPFGPQAWFGSGDLKALLRHIQGAEPKAPKEFRMRPFVGLLDGEEALIELELGPTSLEDLRVNGQALGFPRFLEKPRTVDGYLRLRSVKPMTLLDAELRGERLTAR
ncbi:MAG: serine/threonine-protein kinase [Planctomycetota bacterium]|nr:serine/threonine-protein kinase [Planctomycetota bacterium]